MSPQQKQQTQQAQQEQAIDYFGLHIPFMQFLGLVPDTFTPEVVRTRLAARPELLNSRGAVHGGALMSALDFTLSAAARAHAPDCGMATIDMSTHFLSPAMGDVIIEARCLRLGGSLSFCDGQALDEQGNVLATATATFKIVRPRPGRPC